MKVLLTGATGLIGKVIGRKLVERGHQVYVVTRSAEKARQSLDFPCTPIVADLVADQIKDSQIYEIEGVINLLGENIGEGRWSSDKKSKIYDSRVLGTRHLVSSLGGKTGVLVSGSAMGFYGNRADDILHESEKGGVDFLARVCRDWEQEAQKASCRTVYVRTSMVLAKDGGAMKKLLPLFKMNLGSRLGSGQQWMSWIHIEDIANLFIFALENQQVEGAINACAPHPVQNKLFTEILAKAVDRGTVIPVPEFALKLALGEMSEMVLFSQRGSADKIQRLGFKFKYPNLNEALASIV